MISIATRGLFVGRRPVVVTSVSSRFSTLLANEVQTEGARGVTARHDMVKLEAEEKPTRPHSPYAPKDDATQPPRTRYRGRNYNEDHFISPERPRYQFVEEQNNPDQRGHTPRRGRVRPTSPGGREAQARYLKSKEFVDDMMQLKVEKAWVVAIRRLWGALQEDPTGVNEFMFNATLAVMGRCKRSKEALWILEKMREANIEPDAYTYNAALLACKKRGQVDNSVRLFEEMVESGIAPDVYAYNHLIACCGYDGDWESAQEILSDIRKSGLVPTGQTYTGAIMACGNAGRADEALKLLDVMLAEGIPATEGSISSLISALGKNGFHEEAIQLLRDMQDGKFGIMPNEYCYNAAISACGTVGQYQQALDLLEEMRNSDSVQPARVSYDIVVKICLDAREFDKAEELLSEMTNVGIPVKRGLRVLVDKKKGLSELEHQEPGVTDSSEIKSKRKRGPRIADLGATCSESKSASRTNVTQNDGDDSGEAAAASDERVGSRRRLRVPHDLESIIGIEVRNRPLRRRAATRLYIRRVFDAGEEDNKAEIWRVLEESMADPNVKVSMKMFSSTVHALSLHGHWEDALKVLDLVRERGLEVDERLRKQAIRACSKSKPAQWEQALRLLREIPSPQARTYTVTMNACAREGQVDQCLSLLEDMKAQHCTITTYTYNAILAACARAHPPLWETVLKTLDRMKEESIVPSRVNYVTAARACNLAGRSTEAESLLREANIIEEVGDGDVESDIEVDVEADVSNDVEDKDESVNVIA